LTISHSIQYKVEQALEKARRRATLNREWRLCLTRKRRDSGDGELPVVRPEPLHGISDGELPEQSDSGNLLARLGFKIMLTARHSIQI
jgi:hypothetical protein